MEIENHHLANTAVVIVTGKGHQWAFLDSPMVKILPSNAGGSSSILGRAAKIPHAACPGQKKKKKKDHQWILKLVDEE